MKRILTLILLVCAFNAVQAQSRIAGKNFYVNSTNTALFDTTSTSSSLVKLLFQVIHIVPEQGMKMGQVALRQGAVPVHTMGVLLID
ncbi:hypothetical protein [Gracilimonas sediminicola]|uniref:hypothetical protein n=1 Tax=Gracilimonas sediminicola TaxID=2952158 RepID=UPI0038D379DA